ncbi:hypothetical protein BGZ98_005473 [Dissophora globulifera]|nr:hypothetical protein BGZ98_005473 [Dissophora globulifera]
MIPSRPLGGNTLRYAATVTPAIRPAALHARPRFYSKINNAPGFGVAAAAAPCTNSVRKTLYSVAIPRSRLSTLHPSSAVFPNPSSVTSRFTPMIRRGFADNATSKAAAAASPSSSSAATTAAAASSSSPAKTNGNGGGLMDKLKGMIKKYGYTGVAVYLSISTIDLAVTFVVIKAAGMDKIEIAQDWVVDHLGTYFGYKRNPDHHHGSEDQETVAEGSSTKPSGLWSVFVIAYGIHKLLVPLRVVATSMITPPLVKWLVKRGLIKEVAKKKAVQGGAAAAAAASKP